MSTDQKKKKREQRKKQKRQKLRAKQEEKRAEEKFKKRMEKRDSVGKAPIRLSEEAPMPPRNGPCPLHPEHKLKKCPHGCLQTFKNHRDRVAGVTKIVSVDENAPCPMHPEHPYGKCPHGCAKRGLTGKEVDPASGSLGDLSQSFGTF